MGRKYPAGRKTQAIRAKAASATGTQEVVRRGIFRIVGFLAAYWGGYAEGVPREGASPSIARHPHRSSDFSDSLGRTLLRRGAVKKMFRRGVTGATRGRSEP